MENTGQEEIIEDLTVCQEIGNVDLQLPLAFPAGAPIEVTLELGREGRLHIIGHEPASNEVIEANFETRQGISEDELRMVKERQNRLIIQ
jgi:molecular chaperone DnaK